METIKILHGADWHLSNRQTVAGRFILQDGINLALIDRIKALEKICSYVGEESIDLIIIAGDIFDTSNPEAVAIKVAVQMIERLAEVTPVVLIRGNHDGKTTTASALAPFGKIARRNGIYVFEQPEVFSLIIKNTKVQVFALPYPRRSDFKQDPQLKSASPEEISTYISRKMEEILSGFQAQIEREAINVLIGHFMVAGNIYSKEQQPPPFDISVRKEFLDSFNIVCLGHLHEPQKYYSGTIARNGFGEQDMKPGFKVHEIDGDQVTEHFIELPAREYVTVSVEDFARNGVSVNPETVIRIKGKAPKHEYDELIRKMKGLNLPFLKNDIKIETETAGSNDGDVSEEPDIEQAVRMWAKGREGMDKLLGRLIGTAREIEAQFNESR